MPQQVTKRVYTGELPTDVVECLHNARFLHLATSTPTLRPHIALMNYTYIPPNRVYKPAPPSDGSIPSAYATDPASSASNGPGVIIMLLSPKTKNIALVPSHPLVSLLVHDWISPRPPTGGDSSSPPSSLSPLTSFLKNLNSSELKSHSHTIRGYARILESGGEEEKYYRGVHADANKFEEEKTWVEGNEGSRICVVEVEGGKVADWKGGVEDWGLEEQEALEGNNVE